MVAYALTNDLGYMHLFSMVYDVLESMNPLPCMSVSHDSTTPCFHEQYHIILPGLGGLQNNHRDTYVQTVLSFQRMPHIVGPC